MKEGAQLQVGLRPIVRGKAHARTEFGAKVHINVITIRRMRKYTQDGLQEYHSMHTYVYMRIRVYRNHCHRCHDYHCRLSGNMMKRITESGNSS